MYRKCVSKSYFRSFLIYYVQLSWFEFSRVMTIRLRTCEIKSTFEFYSNYSRELGKLPSVY